jgi:hypothetical protein
LFGRLNEYPKQFVTSYLLHLEYSVLIYQSVSVCLL